MRPSPHSLLFLFLILVALPCCTLDSYPVWMEEKPEPADLSITVSIPAPPTATKAGYWDGDDASLASWGDWERIVDGRQLYNVTLLIIRLRDNTLVAYRDFYMNGTLNDYCDDDDPNSATGYGLNGFWNEAGDALYGNTVAYTTAVKATFDHAHPMHGSIEELATGSYRMLVVANYRSISGVTSTGAVTPKAYGGLVDGASNLTTVIENLRSTFNFNATTGIPNFDAAHYPAIFGHQLHAAKVDDVEQYVCEQVPQPLTLVKDFFVRSGSNTISDAQLVRSYSRIRINVTNESETKDLRIDGILFDAPFAQKSTSLFDFGDDAQFNPALQGVPLVRSAHAIIPFVTGTTIGKMTASQYNEAAIFDAYILESRRPDELYGFKLQIHYDYDPNNDAQDLTPEGQYLLSNQPIRTLQDFRANFVDLGIDHYLVYMFHKNTRGYVYIDGRAYNNSSGQVLYSNSDKNYLPGVPTSGNGLPGMDLSSYKKYIWQFSAKAGSIADVSNSTTNNMYYLKNYLTDATPTSDPYWGDMEPGENNNINPDIRWIRLQPEANKHEYNLYEVSKAQFTQNEWNNFTEPVGGAVLPDDEHLLTLHGVARAETGHAKDDMKFVVTKNSSLRWYMKSTTAVTPDVGGCFQLYPVLIGSAPYPITIQVIDQQTGQPQSLTEIRRNDYVTVHVSVIYHPTPYDLQFIVKPWGAEKDESFQFD